MQTMFSRRRLLKTAAQAAALLAAMPLLRPLLAFAAERNEAAFAAKTLTDVVKAYGGSAAQVSADVDLQAPEIAENGAVVPVTVTSNLPGTRAISILVEKNPSALSARFDIPAGTEPYVSTRIKVAETCNVIALVHTDKGDYYAQKPVKVTLGGCGG